MKKRRSSDSPPGMVVNEKPATLDDIARRLKLSAVTISKALRDHPDISSATKRIVLQTAEEMGYTPNIMARNLSARRTHTIGVVLPKIAHFFFSSIIDHIYNIAHDRKYEVILTVSQESAEREKKHVQTLLAMKVDGIIASLSQETRDYRVFETVGRRGVPLVFLDRVPDLPNISTVVVDDRGGAFKAVERAIALGHRRIGHFGGFVSTNIGRERKAGFLEAMNRYQVPLNESWILEGGFDEEYGYQAFMDLYRRKDLPEFVFAVTHPVAMGIYKAVKEVGMRIPDDVDLICFGNAQVQDFLSPPLSAVDQPTEVMSRSAMELLMEQIARRETYKPRSILVGTDIIVRGTCVQRRQPE